MTEKKPLVLIDSPPCTPFCQLQSLNPTTEKSKDKWREGVEHMMLVISVYRRQIKEIIIFLHKHLADATSWSLGEVQNLAKTQGVSV